MRNRRCCAGAATPRAGRPSSSPIRAIPPTSSASTSRSPTLVADALGRRPEFVQITFTELDQSVSRGDFDIGLSGIEDTPARRAVSVGDDPVLRIPGSAHGARSPIAIGFARSRICKGHAVGTLSGTIAYETLLDAERRPARRPCRTTMTCIRTAICCWAAWMPCCWTTCSPTDAAGKMGGLAIQPALGANGPLRDHPGARPGRPARSRQRHPSRRDARRAARGDLQALERLERRSAAALRAAVVRSRRRGRRRRPARGERGCCRPSGR